MFHFKLFIYLFIFYAYASVQASLGAPRLISRDDLSAPITFGYHGNS